MGASGVFAFVAVLLLFALMGDCTGQGADPDASASPATTEAATTASPPAVAITDAES